MTQAYPDNNPKTAVGVTKVPLHLVPPSTTHYLAMAFADGARKYGPYNWRDKTVSSSVYVAAAKRHMDAWWDGEAVSSDAKVHHLAHALACLAIILDAETVGKLNDDRPTPGAANRLQALYATNNNTEPKQLELPAEHPLRHITGDYEPDPYPHTFTSLAAVKSDAVVERRVPYVQEDVRSQA